jgi:hypothetical protein
MQRPSWFNIALDPNSYECADQQDRLWSLLTRSEHSYTPELISVRR